MLCSVNEFWNTIIRLRFSERKICGDFLKGKYVTKCHVYYSYTYNHHRITVRHICASDV